MMTDATYCFMKSNVSPHQTHGSLVFYMGGGNVEGGSVPIVYENAIVGELVDIVFTYSSAFGTPKFKTDARSKRAKKVFYSKAGSLCTATTEMKILGENESYGGIAGPSQICMSWTLRAYCLDSIEVVGAFPKSTEPRPHATKTTVVRDRNGDIQQTLLEPIDE